MKKWKIYYPTLVTMLLYILTPIRALAEDEQALTYPISYSKGIDILEKFTSKVWVPSEWFGLVNSTVYLINSFVQAVFWVNKTFFYIFSKIYQYLTDTSWFETYLTKALNLGAGIYTSLITGNSATLYAVGVCMASYLVYSYLRGGHFFQTLIKLFLVFICSSLMFQKYQGKYALQHVYNGIDTVMQTIASSSISSVTFDDGDLSTKQSTLNGTKYSNAVLDKYFDIAIWQPYQHMNTEFTYPSTMDGNPAPEPVLTNEELIILLDYNCGDNEFEINGEEIETFVGSDLVKHPMLSTAWGWKFSYAIAGLVDTVVLGVILDVFAVMAAGTKVTLALLFALSGFVSIIAMIPTFENVLFNFFRRLFGTIAVSNLLTIASLLMLWVYDFISAFAATVTFQNAFVSAILKGIIIWYLYKKRDSIISILTANRVTQFSNSVTNRLSGMGDYLKGTVANNALSRLKRAGKASNQLRRGAMKIGAKKVGQNLKRLAPENSKRKSLTKGLQSYGRHLLGQKDKLVGNVKKLRSEGVKNKDGMDYKKLRSEAEKSLKRGNDREEAHVGYKEKIRTKKERTKQQVHNQQTKQRLLSERKQRLENKGVKVTGHRYRSSFTKENFSDKQVRLKKPNDSKRMRPIVINKRK